MKSATSNRQKEIALIMAVIVLAATLWTIFSSPTIYAVSDGSYYTTMDNLKLTWSGDPVPEGQPVEKLAYDMFDYASLLSPGQPAMIYAAALVRLVTQPFGQLFDMRYMAVVYALVVAAGAYLAVRGLMRKKRLVAILAGIAIAVLMMHSGIVGYFHSLYQTGAVIAFLILFIGALINGLTAPEGTGPRNTILTTVCGVLFLQTQFQSLVFIPAVLVGILLTAFHGKPFGNRGMKLYHLFACGMALLFATQSVSAFIADDKDMSSDAAGYLAVFQGYLKETDDPEALLKEIGLDETYVADIGRSYYESGELFVHDPHSETEVCEAVSLSSRLSYALRHPDLILKIIGNRKTYLYDAFNEHLVTEDGNRRYTRPSPYILIDLLTGEGNFGTRNGYMLLAAVISLLLLVPLWKREKDYKICLALSLVFICMLLYLPWCVALDGAVNLSMIKVVYFFFGWVALFTAICQLIVLGQGIFEALANGQLSEDALHDLLPASLPEKCARIHTSRNGITAFCTFLCVFLIVWLVFPQIHAGGINNGDYGRMMEQIDIDWSPELVENSSEQAGVRVVEEYSYREPFHTERLTPLDPTYSLLWPSLLVRLWSMVSGSQFSTHLLGIIMLFMTAGAIILLIYDLYPLLGKVALLPAVLLPVMMFGENYVAWYNSLFGESSISTGLIMTIACSVHLALMPRGKKTHWLWLILLALSIRFLTCAKAQMALALPLGLLLLVSFAIWHHPQNRIRLTAFILLAVMLCGWLSWDTYRVYAKNSEVSEKHTIWQSVFFGALMITDDPDAAMEELNIPLEMKADIGKHAYYADDDYVYSVFSEEAEEKFYSQVNTMTMVLYYLRHPLDFLKMLDRAARESRNLHVGFMAYTDETYVEHDILYRFNLWRMLRPYTACSAFWQYVALYGAGLIYCLIHLFRKKTKGMKRLLLIIFISVMFIGAFQYPLSVVGNGFADNNKQMYCFMLCHDLMVVTVGVVIIRRISDMIKRRREGIKNEKERA